MPALPVAMVGPLLSTGASARVAEVVAARFKAGDAVLARNMNPVGHTRLPRYIRGKHGVIQSDHGVFSFPDTAAHGLGHKAQHLYSVRFGARELWGEGASERDSLYIDLFDDYLDLHAGVANAAARPLAAKPKASPARPRPPVKPMAVEKKQKQEARPKPGPKKTLKAASKSKPKAVARSRSKVVAKANKKKSPARAGR